jgi:hypothetical protein
MCGGSDHLAAFERWPSLPATAAMEKRAAIASISRDDEFERDRACGRPRSGDVSERPDALRLTPQRLKVRERRPWRGIRCIRWHHSSPSGGDATS